MANDQERNTFPVWAWYVLAVVVAVGAVFSLLLVAFAAYRAVIRNGLDLAFWLSVLLQVIVALAGAAVATVVAAFVFFVVGKWTLRQAAEMLRTLRGYDEETQNKIKGGVPTVVTGAVLFGNAVLIYLDKAFGEDTLMVLAASLTCLSLFGAANFFMLSDKRGLRVVGWGIWGVTLLAALMLVMGYYAWGPQDVFGQLIHPLALSSQLVQLAPASDLWKLIVIVLVSVLIGVLFLILPIWSAYFAARKETNTGEDS